MPNLTGLNRLEFCGAAAALPLRWLFSCAGESAIQPCLPGIGGVAVNDAALGCFSESRNERMNLVFYVCAQRELHQPGKTLAQRRREAEWKI